MVFFQVMDCNDSITTYSVIEKVVVAALCLKLALSSLEAYKQGQLFCTTAILYVFVLA